MIQAWFLKFGTKLLPQIQIKKDQIFIAFIISMETQLLYRNFSSEDVSEVLDFFLHIMEEIRNLNTLYVSLED